MRNICPFWRSRLAVAFALMILLSLPRFGFTQGPFGVRGQQNMSRFISPPRYFSQLLRDAEKAIDNEQFGEAVVILGDLLERNIGANDDAAVVGQDFLLGVKDGEQQLITTSFLRRCRALVGSMPSKGRETYELRYGALAKQILSDATERRDWKRLREVRRKYFHTRAGYQASALLAQREVYLGRPLAASMLLDDVVTSPAAVEVLGNEILSMHAIMCRLAGRSIPRDLPELTDPRSSVNAESAEAIDDFRLWVGDNYSSLKQQSVSRSRDYPWLGGAMSRNETVDGQLPISTPRWMLETTATPLEEEMVRGKSEELAASGRLIPPSWTPIRMGNQLLMRTTERLRGVDFRTGKRVWQYPWYDTGALLDDGDGPMNTGPAGALDLLSRRVWNDLPFGQITSDGKRVYLLDDLSEYRIIQFNPVLGPRGPQPSENDSRNTLVALELETEGKTIWRIGQNPTIQSELNNAFFLGAPLAVEDSLYAMVELSGDIVLVCLDAATGTLQWQQQLVSIEGAAVQADPIRRIAGATPTYHQGVLICPTGAGATIAVDLYDRTLRWANSYLRRETVGGGYNSSRSPQATWKWFDRWHHATAIAHQDSIVVTPVETDNLFCFSLVDGKKRFVKSRNKAFYAAGIRDDQLLLVGARDVVAHDMEKGRFLWRTPATLLPPGSQFVGRGVFGPDCYILPTSDDILMKISLEDGELLEERKVGFPLGNLIAIDGELISQGPTRLAVALGARTLGPRVERMLAEDPDNLDALVQKAMLLSEQGDRSGALEVLKRARNIDPESDDVLLLSISAMLDELRENPSPPPGLIKELDALIDTPTQRLELLALQIRSSLAGGLPIDATNQLLRFVDVAGSIARTSLDAGSIVQATNRDCELGEWVAARAAEIARLVESNDELAAVQRRVGEFLEPKLTETTKVMQAISGQLRPLGADPLLVTLAGRKLVEQQPIAAERLLIGPASPDKVFDVSEPSHSPTLLAALAAVYETGGMYQDAIKIADDLLQTTDEDVSNDLQPESAAELEEISRKSEQQLAASVSTLKATENVSLNWQSMTTRLGRTVSYTPKTIYPTIAGSKSLAGWRVINSGGQPTLRDSNGDLVRLPFDQTSSRSSDQKAAISGGLLVLQRPGRVSTFDLFAIRNKRPNDALIWSRDFGAGSSDGIRSVSFSTVFGTSELMYRPNSNAANQLSEFSVGPVLGDRTMVLHAGDLMAVDNLTGQTLWSNSLAPSLGRMVVSGDKVAVVSYARDVIAELTTFDLLDGRELSKSDWEYGQVWATQGQYVLAIEHETGSDSAVVRLVNPFENEVKLELESRIKLPLRSAGGRGMGRVLQDRYLVMIDTAGRLVIWDLKDGTERAHHQVGELPDLQAVRAMWVKDQILVLVENGGDGEKNAPMIRHGDAHRPVHKIIAVDTSSGKINWTRDLESPWGITVDQPYNSPVVLLARSKTTFTIDNQVRKMDVAVIRLSDGKTIHEQMDQVVAQRSTGLTTLVEAKPSQNRLNARISGELLRYEFLPEDDKQPEKEADADE